MFSQHRTHAVCPRPLRHSFQSAIAAGRSASSPAAAAPEPRSAPQLAPALSASLPAGCQGSNMRRHGPMDHGEPQ